MYKQITYADKVGIVPREVHANQVWDIDMNNIKEAINYNGSLIETFADGGGKTYTSIASAMAISPLPSNNTPFTIRDSVSEDGYYIYLSSEVGGYKFLGALYADIDDIIALEAALNNKLETSLKGTANGLAELDAQGFVKNTQLPSYVDDVIEVANFASLPVTGETGKIYITIDNNKTYRWSGTVYTVISETIALGETDSTAYRGDRGKIAYDHSQSGTNTHPQIDTALTRLANTSGINTGDNAINSLYSGLVSNATHTGDVTGSTALTITNDAVTNTKLANMAVNTIKGRITAGTGDPEDLTADNVRTIINVADGANNYVLPFTDNSSNWNTAYGWGNHAGLYLGINSKAADSELLDGFNSTEFYQFKSPTIIAGTNADNLTRGFYFSQGLAVTNLPSTYGSVMVFNEQIYYGWQLFTNSGGEVSTRVKSDIWGSWRTIWDNNNLTNPITGTLTTNKIPKASGTGTLTDSVISEVGGNVLIGTTTDNGAKFQVNGSATFASTVTAGGEVTAYSDARLKNVICKTESVIDKLLKINVIDYKRNDQNTNKVRTGLIAQELRELFPQFVSGNEDEGYLSINYAELVSVCIKAIQELRNG